MKKILLSILFVSSSFSMDNFAEELKGIRAKTKVLNHHVLEADKLKQEKQIRDYKFSWLEDKQASTEWRLKYQTDKVSWLEEKLASTELLLQNQIDKVYLLEEKLASTELLLKDQIDNVSWLEKILRLDEEEVIAEKNASIWNPEEFLADYEKVCDTFEKTVSYIYTNAEGQTYLLNLPSISKKSLVDFIQLKCYNKTGYGISRIGRSEYLPDIMLFPSKLGKYIWSRDKLKHGKAYDYDIIEHKNYYDEVVNALNSHLDFMSSIYPMLLYAGNGYRHIYSTKENERIREMEYFLSLSSKADRFEFCKNKIKTIFDEANIKFEDAKKPLFDFLDKYEHFWSGKQ